MHTTRYGREEKATTEESSKRDVSIFVASASTPLYAVQLQLLHTVLHRNGNQQGRQKARHVSPCAALCTGRARARGEKRERAQEPFWHVAEVPREEKNKKGLRFVCAATSLLVITPGSTQPPVLAEAPPPWMSASSSSLNPK